MVRAKGKAAAKHRAAKQGRIEQGYVYSSTPAGTGRISTRRSLKSSNWHNGTWEDW